MAVREASADPPYIRDKERRPVENRQIERVSKEERVNAVASDQSSSEATFGRPIGRKMQKTGKMERMFLYFTVFHTSRRYWNIVKILRP